MSQRDEWWIVEWRPGPTAGWQAMSIGDTPQDAARYRAVLKRKFPCFGKPGAEFRIDRVVRA